MTAISKGKKIIDLCIYCSFVDDSCFASIPVIFPFFGPQFLFCSRFKGHKEEHVACGVDIHEIRRSK